MAKESLADRFYEDAEDTPEVEGVEFIIVYDFPKNPRTNFYVNLERLASHSEGSS